MGYESQRIWPNIAEATVTVGREFGRIFEAIGRVDFYLYQRGVGGG